MIGPSQVLGIMNENLSKVVTKCLMRSGIWGIWCLSWVSTFVSECLRYTVITEERLKDIF